MKNHLARRGSIWWARLVVPKRLRETAARREFIQSTRTHELHIAKLVASVLVSGWRRQLLALESMPMNPYVLKLIEPAPALDAGLYLSLSNAVASSGMDQTQLLRVAADGGLKLFCRLSNVRGYVVPIRDLELDNPAMGEASGYVMPLAKQMPDSATEAALSDLLEIPDAIQMASAILSGDLEKIELRAFGMQGKPGMFFVSNEFVWCKVGSLEVAAAEVKAIRNRIAAGFTSGQIERAYEERHRAVVPVAAVSAGTGINKRFSEALEAYATEKTGLPQNLASDYEQRQRKNGCALFGEFMGNLKLSEISSDLLRAFRDGPLKTIPGKANHLPATLRRGTTKETVEAIREAGIDWPILSHNMQRERMQWLDRMFTWLTAKEWISKNPSESVRDETGYTKKELNNLKRVKGVNELEDEGRGPFSPEELTLVFEQSWFKSGNGVGINKPRVWYPFEYWLPLLGLFAGCRIKEASQLHLSDIKKTDVGVWYFDINENTVDKSLKNTQSKRKSPISPILIDLGFLEYCDKLKAEGFRRVFPELTHSNSDARYAKEPGRKMSAMFKGLGMPRDSTHVFHCFRHNCNNALFRTKTASGTFSPEVQEYIRKRFLGHEAGTDVNTMSYLDTSPDELIKLINELKFDLPPIAKFDIAYALKQIRIALNKKVSNGVGRKNGREDMGPLNETVYS